MKTLMLTIMGVVLGWLFREIAHDFDHTVFRFEVKGDEPGPFTRWVLNIK